MGFFSNIISNVTPTFTNSISSTMKNVQNGLLYDELGNTARTGGNNKEVKYQEVEDEKRAFAKNEKLQDYNPIYDKSRASGNWASITEKYDEPVSSIAIPRWGYKDFINERVSWQKSIDSLTGEPGWFYFKIFFKFDTNYGLFPGTLSENGTYYKSENSAINYLKLCSNYATVNANSRATSLVKFAKTLSWINSNAPWFFKKISGMEHAGYVDLNDITKEKFIEIECSEDAVDMRLSTLMDFYRYACYDFVNHREIIPENLRKFDMSVVVFHTPLRYYHTSGQSLTQGSFPYKSLHANDMGDKMSFRLVTFTGCEFVTETMTTLPSELNDEKAFNLGQTKIKVKYHKALVTNLNEWFGTMISDVDGILWDDALDLEAEQAARIEGDKNVDESTKAVKAARKNAKEHGKNTVTGGDKTTYGEILDDAKSNRKTARKNRHDSIKSAQAKREENLGKQKKRIEAIKYAIDHRFMYNPNSPQYKSLIDASEDVITNAMRIIKPEDSFGNMYGGYTDIEGDYYRQKLAYERGHDTELKNRFKAMHNKDIADATNPMSDAYQQKLRKFKKSY